MAGLTQKGTFQGQEKRRRRGRGTERGSNAFPGAPAPGVGLGSGLAPRAVVAALLGASGSHRSGRASPHRFHGLRLGARGGRSCGGASGVHLSVDVAAFAAAAGNASAEFLGVRVEFADLWSGSRDRTRH